MNQSVNPIVMTRDEWNRILKWTDENKEDPETTRRKEYLKYLNETSAQMTKSWPNSLENVNKRNEEIRRARIEAAENANTQFYKRYVKRQKETQQRLMHSARDTIFKNKDAPKLLLSAVVESVILKEREEQLKFNEKYVGAYQKEQKRLNDELIITKAKEWNELQKLKKQRRFQVNKQHQKELVDQAHELSERQRKEFEEELQMQRLDIINSNMELEALKEFDKNYREAEKARILADNERSLKETQQRRKEEEARDKMDDQLIEVLMRSRARIEAKRKATEKEVRDEKLRVLDAISKKLESGDAARDAKEQASLNKAIKERNAAVEARHKNQLDKEARFRRERQEARDKFLKDEAQRLHEEHTMAQWGLMNRFKNQEIYEDYKENQRKEKERKTNEYRDIINLQRRERDEREAKELADQREFYGSMAERKLRDDDAKLLRHADALILEAKQHGRPTLPIYKAIDRYCKMYRLYPMPDLPASLREHFSKYAPRDGTGRDSGAVEPPPPPPPRADDDYYDDVDEDGRDGLQDVVKNAQPKPVANKESVKDDYKRQGPANGLQRKPEQDDVRLPAIKTIPCKTKDCNCELNK